MLDRLGVASERRPLRFSDSSTERVQRDAFGPARSYSNAGMEARAVESPDLHERRLTLVSSVQPSKQVTPRYPILLAHGYFGIRFRGVREHLESLGCRVHMLSVSATAGVAFRAAELARQANAIDADRVNIVAHSMGGLDARYAISKLGLSSRVASLVTLGTPHRGTPLADLFESVPLLIGLRDLTTVRAEAFNAAVRDSDSVVYGSFVGVSSRSRRGLFAPLHEYLHGVAGLNDGVVPAHSQRWGRVLGEVDADHLAQIGWSRRFDPRAFYTALVAHIVSFGC